MLQTAVTCLRASACAGTVGTRPNITTRVRTPQLPCPHADPECRSRHITHVGRETPVRKWAARSCSIGGRASPPGWDAGHACRARPAREAVAAIKRHPTQDSNRKRSQSESRSHVHLLYFELTERNSATITMCLHDRTVVSAARIPERQSGEPRHLRGQVSQTLGINLELLVV